MVIYCINKSNILLAPIAFNERKMLRLAFHDCAPYADGSGGCDGCLNLDENLEENNGLQYTVAVLEKMYTDKDYMVPWFLGKMDQSMQEMGISRAGNLDILKRF